MTEKLITANLHTIKAFFLKYTQSMAHLAKAHSLLSMAHQITGITAVRTVQYMLNNVSM